MILEICANGITSALAAEAGGAQRIELCTALALGGLTPSPGIIAEACDRLNIPVFVLIRPRAGSFCYSATELAAMLRSIRFCREAGAAGVVIGALYADKSLDIEQIQAMVAEAQGMDITFHRAFDAVTDPWQAAEDLVQLGIRRVLTSGQMPNAELGSLLIRDLLDKFGEEISFMPGGGVKPENVRTIIEISGCREIHASAKKIHSEEPGMGAEIITDEAAVRTLNKAIQQV